MRRFFAAVLAAAMLLSFAGCAVKDTQSDSTAPAEEQTTEEKSTEPPTNEDGSLVKPKNAVSVSDDVKIKTYSGSSIIEIGNREMEPYGNSYKNMKSYADALNRLKAEMPNTKAYCLMAPTAIEFYAPSKYNTGVSKSQYEGMCYIYEQLKDITPVTTGRPAAHTTPTEPLRMLRTSSPLTRTPCRAASSRRSSDSFITTQRVPCSQMTRTMWNISFRPSTQRPQPPIPTPP